MEYIKRPKSVSIIASLFIAEGVLYFMLVFHLLLDPSRILLDPSKNIGFFVIWVAFVGLFCVVAGITLRNGFNWGRLMILGFTPIVIVLPIIFLGFNPMYIGIGFSYLIGYLIILLFLMQPNVLKYFRSDLSKYSITQKLLLHTG